MNRPIHDYGESPVESMRRYDRQVRRIEWGVNGLLIAGVVLWTLLVIVVARCGPPHWMVSFFGR